MTVQTEGLKPDFILEKSNGDVMKKRHGVLENSTIHECEINGSVSAHN
jgi:hypothetical protein